MRKLFPLLLVLVPGSSAVSGSGSNKQTPAIYADKESVTDYLRIINENIQKDLHSDSLLVVYRDSLKNFKP